MGVEDGQHAARRSPTAPAAPPRRCPGLVVGQLLRRWERCRTGPPGCAPGSRPRSSTARRSRGRASDEARPADGHPAVGVLGDGREDLGVGPSRRSGSATRGCWTGLGQLQHGSSDDVAHRGTRPGPRTTAPACTGRARGPSPAGRRSPPRGRPPPRGSSRSRCRAPPVPRSGGRGWRSAWPARWGRAGRPAPPRCRAGSGRSPRPPWTGPRTGRGCAGSRRRWTPSTRAGGVSARTGRWVCSGR